MKPRQDCPGCGGSRLTAAFVLPKQPVVLNYRFRSAADARAVPRRNVHLVQCRGCSLVFNAEFEPDITPYDQNYENRQGFSPVFRAHVTDLIHRLAQVPGVRGGRILEVGCGKGDFLREAAATTGARADGYDTSYEGPPIEDNGRIRFFSSYVSASNVDGRYDAVICRHVVEHVPGIGAFLKELAGIARAAGDPLVVVETPRFEWIVENRCLWDVFYEHCNYFTQPALAHLARLAGFKVVRHSPVFGDQYQWLELRLARRASPPAPPGIPPKARLSTFARSARRQLDGLVTRIRTERNGRQWAIWGAGAKGVALANLLPRIRPAYVVDSNPAKQGGVLTGTSIPIIAPHDPRIGDFGLVVIANPNYAEEIRADLAKARFSGKTFCL